MFIETPKNEEELKEFISQDPYVKNQGVVDSFEISQFEYDGKREFHKVAENFLYRG